MSTNVKKLNEKDIGTVKNLLMAGEHFKSVAKIFQISRPTLIDFLLKNDLYKYCTNQKSVKIAKSRLRKSSIKNISFKCIANKNEIMSIREERRDILERLIELGKSYSDFEKIYGTTRNTVRYCLQDLDLYEKYNNSRDIRKSTNKQKSNNKSIAKEDIFDVSDKFEQLEVTYDDTSLKSNKTEDVESKKNDHISILNELVVNNMVADYIKNNIEQINREASKQYLQKSIIDIIVSNSNNISNDGSFTDAAKENMKRDINNLIDSL